MAAITDKFNKASAGTRAEPTTLVAQKTIGATSLSAAALNGWPTDTAAHFQIYRTNTQNEIIAGTQSDWKGVVSGTTITQLQLQAGNDDNYPIGSVIVALPTAAWADDLVDGLIGPTGSLNQDGSLKTTSIPNNSVTNAKIVDGAVTSDKLASGSVVQLVATDSRATTSGGTLMVLDNTIPQNNEGNEFLTRTITPKSATNRLFIEVRFFCSYSGSVADIAGALFKDSDVNAIAADSIVQGGTTYKNLFVLTADVLAGSTAPATYKFRAGANGAGNLYMNQNGNGTPLFGGVANSTIKITEYKP